MQGLADTEPTKDERVNLIHNEHVKMRTLSSSKLINI